jgi:tryptophan synthase
MCLSWESPFPTPLPTAPQYNNQPSYSLLTQIALQNNITLQDCLAFVKTARAQGLTVPVLLMGYFNPFLSYGEERLMSDCKEVGVNGFICVDLPPEEAIRFRNGCLTFGLSYIPLITPSTSESRMKKLVTTASSFIYVVSTSGVTGARDSVDEELPALIERVKKHTNLPLAVGFGVSTREHFVKVGAHAEGVVIGSKIITTVLNANAHERVRKLKEYALMVTGRLENDLLKMSEVAQSLSMVSSEIGEQSHILPARFGEFGGQYAPEALVDCLEEIEIAFHTAMSDPSFKKELDSYNSFCNRPSNIHVADRLTEACGGARIWLKREDLNHVFKS